MKLVSEVVEKKARIGFEGICNEIRGRRTCRCAECGSAALMS